MTSKYGIDLFIVAKLHILTKMLVEISISHNLLNISKSVFMSHSNLH